MTALDILIIFLYFVVVIFLGFISKKYSGRGLEGYFLAGRSLPWYLAGISMVATTYAVDTPLAVTGIIRKYGISGNWLWWTWIPCYCLVAVLFAQLWRKSGVITDVELTIMRYGNVPSARLLRCIKALLLGVVINLIVLGWVFLAMVKVIHGVLPQSFLASMDRFASQWVPEFMVISTPSATLIFLLILVIVLVYEWLGGLRGVVLTDFLQFAIVIVVAIVISMYAWNAVSSLPEKVPISDKYLNLLPGENRFPISFFIICAFAGWWAHYSSDGTGYIAQRINSTIDTRHARLAVYLFVFVHFCIRIIPWLIAGIASLYLFPPDAPATFFAEGDIVAKDPEATYPVLIKKFLGPGWFGLAIASLMAAFMSTVDTHLNWGASCIVNDIVIPLKNPPPQKTLIISRLTSIFLAIAGILVAANLKDISSAWIIAGATGAGMGAAQILRWFWWRINAWSELTAILSSLAITIIAITKNMNEFHVLALSGTTSFFIAIVTALITPPPEHSVIREFCNRVNPPGLWPEKAPIISLWFVPKWLLVSCTITLFLAGEVLLIIFVLT